MGMRKLGKIAYGSLFAVIIPIYLYLLSQKLTIDLPLVLSPNIGGVFALVGLIIMCWAMLDIKMKGKGLPMNAYPPKKLVTDGIYGWIAHPIYVGFSLIVFGGAIVMKSSSGVYILTPVVIAGCVALAIGYENHDLKQRFGRLPHPILGARRILAPIAHFIHLDRLWHYLIHWAEKRANSWKSWQFGPLRVMNHFLYSGLAGGIGAAVMTLVVGKSGLIYIVIFMLAGLLGSALIGQVFVGSSNQLSRPFGYFGGLLGISLLGVGLSIPFPESLTVLAGVSFAAPWVQGIGRVRCLVQGCCHGDDTTAERGIVVTNPHSRVCALSNKCHVSIHPTQLYSMVGNLILGCYLFFLWLLCVEATVIIGSYLIGAGATRFIEESFRGEPLTPIINGLRLYQWLSIGMYVAGLVVYFISSHQVPKLDFKSWPFPMIIGIVFFFVCGLAMSSDFPNSNRRFSRLSG